MESMKKVVGPGIVVPSDRKDNEVAGMTNDVLHSERDYQRAVLSPGLTVGCVKDKQSPYTYMMGHCSLEETLEKDFSVAMGRHEEGCRSLRNITSLGIYTDLPEIFSILPSMQRVLTLGEQ